MLGHVVADHFVTAGFEVHASIRRRSLADRLNPATRLHDYDATCEPVAALDRLHPAPHGGQLHRTGQAARCRVRAAAGDQAERTFPPRSGAGLRNELVRDWCISAPIASSLECCRSARRYTEEDQSDARDLYGLTKYLGEVHVPRSLTLRTSIIGWELERSSGPTRMVCQPGGGRVNGFTRAVFSGLTTHALARVIEWLTTEHPQLSGLYHVSSEPITKYELLLALRDVLALEVEIVPVDEPVINRALDSDRLRQLDRAHGAVVGRDAHRVRRQEGRTYCNDAG